MKTTFRTAILVICVVIGTGAQGPGGRARAGATGLATFGLSIEFSTRNGHFQEFHFLVRDYPGLFGGLSLFGSLLGIVFPQPASHSHLRNLSEHYLEA